jgi:3-dehydroquinate synthase
MMQRTIPVRLKRVVNRSYAVRVEVGIVDSLPEFFRRNWGRRRIFIITDTNVGRLYGRRLLRALSLSGLDASMLDFPAGEESKNAAVVFALHSQLLGLGIRRDSCIVALGGGVVGDVAGFVAATVLRGISFIQVPTTLLAQVDSSVGGKVGIDHPKGKNLIGAFHQPVAVFVDPAVLKTLPVTEFKNGLAEMVKIAAAVDKRLFGRIERRAGVIRRGNERLLGSLLVRAIELKAAVVEKDEFDAGLRAVLNFGHTLAHAIEASSGYSIKHGAAVAMGMASEARIAMRMGLLRESDFKRLLLVMRALGLPVKFPRITSRPKFLFALSADKKASGNRLKFTLLKGIGHAVVGVEVPTPFILELLNGSR